jgi:hypothetical protein
MHISPLQQALIDYLIAGLIWAFIVEYLDSQQPKSKLGRSTIARLVVVFTWPLTLFMFIVSLIHNLIHKK